MAKGRSVEDTFAQLAALKSAGPAVLAEMLPKFLSSKINLIVAKAADLAREKEVKSLQPQLTEAFDRFMDRPSETDKGCEAKQAIANALYEMGCDAADLFLTGIRHRQPEGSYGPPVDTAAELRGICALGLVRMAYRDAMNELVDLLTDESHQSRIMAARAIAYAGRDEGALLLRLKILVGDPVEDVVAECLIALGNLSRAKALPFIRKYLDSRSPMIAESAALALGEMRNANALSALLEQWERDPFTCKSLALPIALSRLPQSQEFLINVVAQAKEEIAAAAVEALRIYRHDDALRARVRAAVEGRNLPKLTDVLRRTFGE
jgi:HEAT repeat protein